MFDAKNVPGKAMNFSFIYPHFLWGRVRFVLEIYDSLINAFFYFFFPSVWLLAVFSFAEFHNQFFYGPKSSNFVIM